ncbi:MAG: NAD-dependent epimerase/dehydratase family protein [Actinomycetota bacterium]
MSVLVVNGAGSELGVRLVRRLAADDGVERIVALTRRRSNPFDDLGQVQVLRGGPEQESVATELATADVIVNLANVARSSAPQTGAGLVELNRTLLAGATRASSVVHVSSATVYGAWAANPIPITERAPRRPNPGFVFAEQRLQGEQLVESWGRERSAAVAVLRPVAAVAEDHRSWLAAQLLEASAVESADHDPAWQILHLDDLASAIALVAISRTAGCFNVAPDGWLTGEERRALLPGRARVRLPDPVVGAARRARRSVRAAADGIEPYLTHPWVVSNDRIKTLGWAPAWRNDEALVVAERVPAWATLNARQRQYASLGALGAVGAGAAAGLGWLARRSTR